MTARQIGYAQVWLWVKAFLVGVHTTTIRTVVWALLCLLVAQQLTPAALARALPVDEGGNGRNRLRRVQRWRQGPALPSSVVCRRLVAAALPLLPPGQPVLVALDTTRTGPWEIFMAGIVLAHRTLPVAWAVMPYPWPRGRFRATTLDLLQELQAAFPKDRPWVLLADRGFPSARLFAALVKGATGFTVRLGLNHWLEVEGAYASVKEHLEKGRLQEGQRVAARIGNGRKNSPRSLAWVVVHSQIPDPPKHKRNPGTARERQAREKARQAHVEHKRPKAPSAAVHRYAHTWVLFTTAGSVAEAVSQYSQRMGVEETFRDWHHGWKVRDATAGLRQEGEVSRWVGIVVLGYRLQMELGLRSTQGEGASRRRAQWTSTGRVSPFWCGQQVFQDRGFDWSGWLAKQWEHLVLPAIEPDLSEKAA